MILCAVNASQPLHGDAALEAIRDAGKLQNTIVVLTQADKLAPADREDMFDNILKTDSDCPDLDQLKGVVAVINRDHSDQVSLVQAVDAEHHKFEAMLFEASGQYATDGIKDALREGMTTQKLLEKLDSLYKVHMQTEWGPKVLQQIHVASCIAGEELLTLLPAPDKLTPARILEDLHSKVGTQLPIH